MKTGDKVEKGAPLLLLEDKESKELTDAQKALDEARLQFELAMLGKDITNSVYNNVQSGNVSSMATYQSRIVAAEAEINKWQKLVDEAQNAIDQLNTAQANVKASGDPDTSSEQAKVNTAQATLDSDEIKIAKDDITRWQNEKAACDAIIKKWHEGITETVSGNEVIGVVSQEELQENAVGASIDAPISGTITSVTVKAGDEAQPDTALVTMQPEGKGFTMSFSVTNDQAKRLSVGDKADLVNSWRYSDMDITLASIKPDTTDPGQKKLLTFDITGDEVTPGQSLNVSVGQKSANYDLIVPNSAIREDSNGKFILIVESKSSPLGNRYVATRVDVEVLASDDTQSAVSGALYGYEFVITTSTQPVEAGKLVRLANNS